MSLHALTEFGGGGHKSSGWDWQSCPWSLGPTCSGCKVAVIGPTPGREGSADLKIMTLPPLLRFTLTISPHDPISLCPRPVSKAWWSYHVCGNIKSWPNNLHAHILLFQKRTKKRLSICKEYSKNISQFFKANRLNIHGAKYFAANRSPMLVSYIFHIH